MRKTGYLFANHAFAIYRIFKYCVYDDFRYQYVLHYFPTYPIDKT